MYFSIVTSFHETPSEYIRDVSKSVLTQTYSDWEWVITDDSETASGDVLDLTRVDSRIRYVKCKSHELYWNPHIFSSKDARVIVVLDADDMITPKFLEVTKNIYENISEDVSCVHYNSWHFNEDFRSDNFNKLRNCTYWEDFTNYRKEWFTHYMDYNKKLGELFGGIRTYRNSKILRFITEDQYENRSPIGNDLLMILYLETKGRILYIDRPLHLVRVKESAGRSPESYEEAWKYYKSIVPKLGVECTLEHMECSESIRSTAFSSLLTKSRSCRIKFVPELCSSSQYLFKDHTIVQEDAEYLFYNGTYSSVEEIQNVIDSESYDSEVNILIVNDLKKSKSVIEYLQSNYVNAVWYVHGNHYTYIRIIKGGV